MRVTLDTLKNFNLYENLPEKVKNLNYGEFLVLYYDVDEENLKLKVFELKTVVKINYTLYKGIRQKYQEYQSAVKVGFFSNTFETRDGLFYQFLRTYNSAEDVSKFYAYAVEQDMSIATNIETNAITEIYNSDDFRRSISYFCERRLQSIMFVYDMVNEAFQKNLSINLYGQKLKKVVNLVKYQGGIMPEIGGTFRFMVIGENANLTETQKLRLAEAKSLLRSLNPMELIYSKTGWILGSKDGKWRTNIADNEASINYNSIVKYNDMDLYIPKNNTIEQVFPLLNEPDKLYSLGYKGKLSDVLHHPNLYEYYPKLALMPVIYFFGKNGGSNMFYFANNNLGGFILINGNESSGSSLSILLHETQHSIQRIENFATGGNELFAKFVISVGSSEVRKIFASINKIGRLFRDNMLDEQSRIDLSYILKTTIFKTQQGKQLKAEIQKILSNQITYERETPSLVFYLVLLISNEGDINSSELVEFLSSKMGNIIYEIFENISESYKKTKKFEEKAKFEDGISEEDLPSIMFKAYENLYGELESRSVQSGRLVEVQLKNYFFLEKWDISPIETITVIDGVEEVVDLSDVVAAIETKNDEYVLHFQKGQSSLPFIHELAHIVYDALKELGYEQEIKKDFDETNSVFTDVDEYFVSRFLGYIKERIESIDILEDFRKDNKISASENINKILDEFFANRESDEKMNYLKTLLSLIDEQ
jgi:hypothetical protein